MRLYREIQSEITLLYSASKDSVSKKEALITLEIMFGLYMAGEELKKEGVLGLEESKGKSAIESFILKRSALLLTGGVFIPETTDKSHLKPVNFITYIQQAMTFFCDKWDTAGPSIRTNLIVTLLTHNTLTYPRLVTYLQKWVSPDKSNLELLLISWLYSDMNDAFTGAENSISNRVTVASQIVTHYKTMRDEKKTYCIFWSNLLNQVDRAFSLKYDKGRMHEKIKANRTLLHTTFTGYLSAQEIDIFIDVCFDDVYNWVILGGEDDEEED